MIAFEIARAKMNSAVRPEYLLALNSPKVYSAWQISLVGTFLRSSQMSFLEDLMKSQAGNSMKQDKTESATKIDQPENRTMKSKTAESREAAPPPAPGFSITNETPKRLTLLGSNGRKLILSPLERTANLGAQVRDDFDFARLEQANEIRVSLVEASTRIEDVLPIIITILFLEFFSRE